LNLVEPFLDAHEGHCTAALLRESDNRQTVGLLKEETNREKKPKWLGWESSETKSDDLKKVRRQTDQRMNQQDVQKAQRDEAEKKNQSPSLRSARDRPARQGHQ
jgi:hypothetical protein